MFLGAFIAFLLLPGIIREFIPLLLFLYDPFKGDGNISGLVILGVGLSILMWCVRDFYVSGKGTLAPWDPPQKLVIVGLYRYARNPMYIGVLIILTGWIIVSASPMVLGFAIVLSFAFHIRVIVSEEPWAEKTFGSGWLDYKRNVPRWLPRLRCYYPDN